MNIEIHDPEIEARLRRQVETTGSQNLEEALRHLLETQEEQDRWISQNRGMIDAKVARGLQQLQRGEGITDERLDAYLGNLKAKPK